MTARPGIRFQNIVEGLAVGALAGLAAHSHGANPPVSIGFGLAAAVSTPVVMNAVRRLTGNQPV